MATFRPTVGNSVPSVNFAMGQAFVVIADVLMGHLVPSIGAQRSKHVLDRIGVRVLNSFVRNALVGLVICRIIVAQ
jgi:hypothetical protein